MSQRQQNILANIVKIYSKTAYPVSSKQLEEMGHFDVSSATLRAEMSELEDTGYLMHSHTSGGRLPTDKGYRYFVDNILTDRYDGLDQKSKAYIQNVVNLYHDFGSNTLNRSLARAAAELSDHLVITSLDKSRDIYKVGLSSLFGLPDFSILEHISGVTSFFDEFEDLFYGMNEHFFRPARAHDDDIYLYIGRENPFSHIQAQTMITTRYRLPNADTGSLTLVGPTRMNYARNIALMRYIKDQINNLT